MTAVANIIEACDGPFRAWLEPGEPWAPWRTCLKAMSGLEMELDELELYERCTGRDMPPVDPARETWCIVGRRGRKSAIAAIIAVYQAIYVDWSRYRAPGETLRVLVVANTKDQAGLVRSYAEAIPRSRPGLERLIESSDTETIKLVNCIEIKCVANSFRSIRGPTVVAAIFEELAFWRDDTSANPGKEVLRAVKPSMLTVPGSVLIGISSPYARRGLLFEKFRDHYGKLGRVLVWRADTLTMNPLADAEEIDQAYADDHEAARAEYGAEFREDIADFITREAIEACIEPETRERPPLRQWRYVGFVDPSGGSADSMTLAVAHREADTAILDCIREVKPPFSPEAVVAEFAELLKSYRCNVVAGDRYASEWPREQFRKHGVWYAVAPRTKSELYRDFLPLVNSRAVDLLDHDRLVAQLVGLERRTARGGRDTVDHAPGGHDDVANAVAGVLVHAARGVDRPEQPIELDPFRRSSFNELLELSRKRRMAEEEAL